uniref:Ig-like domain-containing protein n=1 Tax=Buteo japonicus TaxID=224669 RepID=A0A8C0B1C2_9AVES
MHPCCLTVTCTVHPGGMPNPYCDVRFKKTHMLIQMGTPVFLKQVSDVEVWQGDVARFSVTVTGSPAPKIQWFFNMFAGNDHSLILPYAGVQDEGDYTCVASNVHGKTTCSAHLHVRQRIPGLPCFAREPDSVRCTEASQGLLR